MIDLDDVPDLRPVPTARRAADEALLRATVRDTAAHRPRRRLALVAGVSAGAVAAVVAAAAAGLVLSARGADVHDSARCYSTVSSDFGDGFPGTTVGIAGRPGEPAVDVPSEVIEVCGAVWAAGLFDPAGPSAAPSSAGQKSGSLPTDRAVPVLTACVLPSGEAAVFPGPAGTCTQLGLAPLGAR